MSDIYSSDERLFNYAVEQVIKQGRPAMRPNGMCAYTMQDSNGNTLRCAAGWLLKDEHLALNLAGGIEGIMQDYHDIGAYLGHTTARAHLVLKLQGAHDDAALDTAHSGTDEAFVLRFRELARRIAYLNGWEWKHAAPAST